MLLELVTFTLIAEVESNNTDAPFWKLLPLIITVVPPAAGPIVGKRLEIVGARTALTIIVPVIWRWPLPHSDVVQAKANVPAVVAVNVRVPVFPLPTLMPSSMYVIIKIP